MCVRANGNDVLVREIMINNVHVCEIMVNVIPVYENFNTHYRITMCTKE